MAESAGKDQSKLDQWSSRFRPLTWTPSWLRWDHDGNHELTWGMNIIFGIASAFSVANLYYTHPILNIIADDFGVSNERAALVPSVTQAGYAAGLLFIIPLGDIVRRRAMILELIFATALVWLGCTLTRSFSTFLGLSFVVGLFTVTPQLMFPLAIQYAPQRHKATMTSVVMSGIVFGILVARLVSGIASQYTSWRNVYWIAFGLQGLIWILLFLFMPDYPSSRPDASYVRTLVKIVKLPFKEPKLTQMSLIAFLVMGMFTSFWTTLTFQLADVFHLSTLAIGLFALIGISPVFLNPIVSRFVISRMHPHGTLLIAHLLTLASVCIGTFVGTFSLAGPVLWAFFGDLGMTTITVASRMAFSTVDPTSQNAVNSVYMVFTFSGQLFGTAVGNALYARGGWTYSGALSIAQIVLSMLLIVTKGPHEPGWLGWRGGWNLRSPQAKQPSPPQGSVGDVEAGTEKQVQTDQ
ncbi:major facilitator superfamily domain-containing protein [Xylariomycetidae sp. FL0641]|nr:major facilitator superfamily domain-containing protein [Xylariomycetidae sp. FL0641]